MPPLPEDPGREPTKHRAGAPGPVILPYVLDCFEQGHSAAEVRRQLVALGCTPEEAGGLVESAAAIRADAPRESAWAAEDRPARRFMSLGFFLVVLGISVGFLRVILTPRDATISVGMAAIFWGALALGMLSFFLGVTRLNVRRR